MVNVNVATPQFAVSTLKVKSTYDTTGSPTLEATVSCRMVTLVCVDCYLALRALANRGIWSDLFWDAFIGCEAPPDLYGIAFGPRKRVCWPSIGECVSIARPKEDVDRSCVRNESGEHLLAKLSALSGVPYKLLFLKVVVVVLASASRHLNVAKDVVLTIVTDVTSKPSATSVSNAQSAHYVITSIGSVFFVVRHFPPLSEQANVGVPDSLLAILRA